MSVPSCRTLDHRKEVCREFPTRCMMKGCTMMVTKANTHAHRQHECEGYTVVCQVCKETLLLKGLEAHHTNHNWLARVPETRCPMVIDGCQFKSETVGAVAAHVSVCSRWRLDCIRCKSPLTRATVGAHACGPDSDFSVLVDVNGVIVERRVRAKEVWATGPTLWRADDDCPPIGLVRPQVSSSRA